MKTCPQCGSGFVGFEKLCDICRRAPVAQRKERPKAKAEGSTPSEGSKDYERVKKWRKKHPERYRKYQRELMRKRKK